METITGSDTMNMEDLLMEIVVPFVLIECVILFNALLIFGILEGLGVIQ